MAFTQNQMTESPQKRVEKFRTSKSGDYNVKTRCYPMEVSVLSDMQHYVTFFINMRGKSKVISTNKPAASSEITSGGENRVNTQNLQYAVPAALGVGAMGAARFAGQVAAKRATLGGATPMSAVKQGIATSAAVAGTAALASAFLVKPDTSYRISDAITLHISQAPSVNYSASYDNVELGALIGNISGGSSSVDTANTSAALEATRAIMMATAKLPNQFQARTGITDQNLRTAVKATTKQNLNPYREVLFKSIGFRKFAFDYRFFPKSAEEAANVYEIIKTFKYHMHPEMSEGGIYYIHPSEFNIQYYFMGGENQYMNKISTCVLEDMHVEYGGQEQFTTFADGAPVEISMRLIFQETETLTKERIDQGY